MVRTRRFKLQHVIHGVLWSSLLLVVALVLLCMATMYGHHVCLAYIIFSKAMEMNKICDTNNASHWVIKTLWWDKILTVIYHQINTCFLFSTASSFPSWWMKNLTCVSSNYALVNPSEVRMSKSHGNSYLRCQYTCLKGGHIEHSIHIDVHKSPYNDNNSCDVKPHFEYYDIIYSR